MSRRFQLLAFTSAALLAVAAHAQTPITLDLVLEVALTPERRLARADAEIVRRNLERLGYYLQGPNEVLDPLVAGGVGDG